MKVTLRIVQCGILMSIVMYLAWEQFIGELDRLPGDSQVVHGTPSQRYR